MLGAVANNGTGVSGVAPGVRYAGLRLTADYTTDAEEADALGHARESIDVYSNSWGPEDDGKRLEGPGWQTLGAGNASLSLKS